eukprot:9253078-Ditylum_brightwellii.AAC.1
MQDLFEVLGQTAKLDLLCAITVCHKGGAPDPVSCHSAIWGHANASAWVALKPRLDVMFLHHLQKMPDTLDKRLIILVILV